MAQILNQVTTFFWFYSESLRSVKQPQYMQLIGNSIELISINLNVSEIDPKKVADYFSR